MSRHDRQVSLASSYYPVLIDRTTIPTDSHAEAQAQAQPTVTALTSRPYPTGPRLRRPFPLALLGLADIVYTVRTWLIQPSERVPSIHLLVLSLVRALVLIGALGMSTRWRARGGWIGSLSIVTLGCVVWEGCKGQLVRRRTINGGLEGSKVDTTFLIVTAVFAILEILSFMLLLRLSPPSHRQNPFSLRLPNSAIQSPTPFNYSEGPAYLSTPTRRRYRNLSHEYRPPFGIPPETDHESILGVDPRLVGDGSRSGSGSDITHDMYDNDDAFETRDYLDDDHNDIDNIDDDDEIDDFDDSISSISESSIIDLPPPLEPNRLLPPSVSLNSGLSLAALDSSPVIGPLIRRTRSARFTSIRILSRSGSGQANGMGRERELSDGYGTFGVGDDRA